MWEFISGIGSKITDVIAGILSSINAGEDIIERLDAITFDSTTQIYQFFSTFRYVVGDEAYIMLTSLIILGMSFVLFKLLKAGVNGVLSFIPGFSIRLP